MAFDGTLISFVNGGDTFPLSYVYKESYSVVPNRRQDLDSTRDANGNLQRTVLDHTASTITLDTMTMDNTKMSALMSLIRSHYVVESEKKLNLRYYCPDIDGYKTGYFYIPDVEFPIYSVDVKNKKIMYKSITLEFIEY